VASGSTRTQPDRHADDHHGGGGAIAEFERGLLLERQREGVAKAKQDGKYKGRTNGTRQGRRGGQARRWGLQRTEIARRIGIGIASVYRVLADAKKGVDDQKAAA
jgi:DNA invertase Pin-like site-specific DNA recombinase